MLNIAVSEVEYQFRAVPPLLARIYRPSGGGPFPALISVHGGGWVGNDRTSNQALDVGLAERGILIAAIDFRMPPHARYPTSIADINYAIRWLKHNASRHGTRPELVGGIGTSSGGHQLLLSAMRPRDPRYVALSLEGDQVRGAELASVVLCWPVVDPWSRYTMAKSRQADDMLRTQDAYFGDEGVMREADPLRCLESGENVDLPPTLLIDGSADDRLTSHGLERFVAAYTRAGGEIWRERFEGQGHTFIIKDPTGASSIRALDEIASFVHSVAKQGQLSHVETGEHSRGLGKGRVHGGR